MKHKIFLNVHISFQMNDEKLIDFLERNQLKNFTDNRYIFLKYLYII